MTIQKLYKEIPEVPMIVEATMEEQVSNIGEVIKGFCTKIEDLESCTVPGTPPEEREQREKTMQTSVAKIKILEQECTRMCDESTHIWTQLTMNPELKVMEDKIRSVQEKAHQENESINTLPPVEWMTTILANRQLYVEVEQMKVEHKSIVQKLEPLQDEALRGDRGVGHYAGHDEASKCRTLRRSSQL
jgi:hypothetical protein